MMAGGDPFSRRSRKLLAQAAFAILVVFGLLWSGGKAVAETITFRSGEHATFSRLVLDIPRGADWRIEPGDDGYLLIMDARHVYDTRRAFDRIPRTRLADLRTGGTPGQLELVLACDCHVTAFLFRPDKLVIDVNDGPAPEGPAPRDAPPEGIVSGPEPIRPVVDPRPPGPELGDGLLPLGLPSALSWPTGQAPGAGVDEAAATRLFDPALLGGADPAPAGEEAETAARTAELETALLESLARAGAQGIVDFRLDRTASDPPPPPPRDPVVPPDPEPLDPDALPGLRIETAFDQFRTGASPRSVNPEGQSCLADDLLDLAAWGDERPFGAQIGERQTGIVDAADSLSEEGLLQLARTYLHFGFGEEALAVLALDDRNSVERDALAAIARLLEGRNAGPAPVFAGQRGCTGAVALWVALERDSIEGTSDAERTAMIRTQQLLPAPVRAQIGLRLSELFLDIGDPAAAAQILDETGTKDTDGAVRNETIEAEIARQTEGNAAAIDRLARLAQSDPRVEPPALTELMQLYLAEGLPVPETTLKLAATVRQEHRGTAAEGALALAEIRALLFEDRFDEALALRRRELGGLSPELLATVDVETFLAISSRLDEDAFLPLVFGLEPADLPHAATNAIARRLLSLGFAGEALAFISSPATGDDMEERRLIRDEATTVLGGLRTEPAATGERLSETTGTLPQSPPERPIAEAPVPDPDLEPDRQTNFGEIPDLAPLAERRSLLGEAEATRLRAEAILQQSPFED